MNTCNVISSKDNALNLPGSPVILTFDKIMTMNNITQLKRLEKQYDEFIDKYIRILQLYDVIDKYLAIRDALTVRINQLYRERRLSLLSIIE